MSDGFMLGAGLAITVALLIFAPFAAIWAINTLFGAGIPFTFWNWVAMSVLVEIMCPFRSRSPRR